MLPVFQDQNFLSISRRNADSIFAFFVIAQTIITNNKYQTYVEKLHTLTVKFAFLISSFREHLSFTSELQVITCGSLSGSGPMLFNKIDVHCCFFKRLLSK